METRQAFLNRAANRLKRELFRLPAVRIYRAYEYHEALERHALRLPSLDPRDLPTLEALRRDGAYLTPIESLGLPGTNEMLAACDKLVSELRALPANGDNAPRLPIQRVMEFPEIYMWGLGVRLLDFVENYLGLPTRYHGMDLRREIADGRTTEVRQWHVDAEDHRMFKIILYLNDVEVGGGPFEYLPRPLTIQAVKALRYGSGFVRDEDLAAVVPTSQWVACVAKARTAAIADTCHVFHRAQPAQKNDRYSITYSWTSTTAVKTYPSTPISDQAYSYIMAHTGERQRACMPPRNGH